MNGKKLTLALVAVIIISIISAGYTAMERLKREAGHRGVTIAVVYDEAVSLGRLQGLAPEEALCAYRDAGAGTVLVKEPTVLDASLSGEFALLTGRELLVRDFDGLFGAMDGGFRDSVRPDYQYLVFTDRRSFDRVLGQLMAKNVPARAREGSGVYVIETGYGRALLEQVGVGIPDEAVENIRAAGMDVMVQLRSWHQVTPEGMEYVVEETGKIPGLAGIMFNDPWLPGVPDMIRTLAYELKKTGIPLVQIEFYPQSGFSKLGVLMDKNVLRLHTITLEEDARKNYGMADMVDRFTLASTDRNIRVLLVHGYLKTDVPDALAMNLRLVEEIRDRLVDESLRVGEPSRLQPMALSRGIMFLTGLGVIAGGMLLLTIAFGWRRPALYLGLAGLLLWAALLAADMVNPARKLMAFAAVVIFPTLALSLTVRRDGSPPARCVLLLLQTSLLSMVGALLMVGLLADKGFMLKLDQFTGVKLAHLLPLAMVAVIFFFRGEGEGTGWRERLKKFMDQPILVKFAFVAGVLMVALLIYVSRTGNESAAISPLELKFRALLDNLLGVRPRTKEFLLGHPLLLLLFYLGYRNNSYQPLLLAGVIGQVSLVNTYAHIHTPLAISLLRSFNGLWLGVVLGLALIVAWCIGERFCRRYINGTSSS